jgi:tyrosine recombinase XerC
MADSSAAPGKELVERYLTALQAERNLSAYTLRNYRSDLESLLEALCAAGCDPLEMTRQDFRGYLAGMSESGTARASIARRVSTAHSFYRYLAREGLLRGDPLEGVRPPRPERRLPRSITREQLQRLIEAPAGETPAALRDRAILEVLYGAGLRVSELAGLDLGSLDRDEWRLRVLGKGSKERIVLFGAPAAESLDRYLRAGRPHLVRGAASALFLNRSGGRLSVRAIELLVQKYGKQAGIAQHLHPHLLRHSFATDMLDGGADLRIVQELLGHASASTTQIYTHVTEERQRQVYTEAFYKQWRPRSERQAARARRMAPAPVAETG